MSKLSENLARKIESDTGIICNPDTFARTYAGRNQKANGAIVWEMVSKNGARIIGSSWPATECVKKKYVLQYAVIDGVGMIFPEQKLDLQN